MQGSLVVAVAIGYLGALIGLAILVDRRRPGPMAGPLRPYLYALSLGVYCTSWAYYGAVGDATETGWSFIALPLGPALLLLLFAPTLARFARLAREQNFASIADFISARYGKSERVAALVTVTVLLGVVPYIALQLIAIDLAIGLIVGPEAGAVLDPALFVAAALAVLAMVFGTKQISTTERHDGLVVAVALESVVKLAALLAVGVYAFVAIDGAPDGAPGSPGGSALAQAPSAARWFALALLGFVSFLALPHQFHMGLVENRDERDVRVARWMTPVYFALFCLPVAPIAFAGLAVFPEGGVPADLFVLALPLATGAPWLAAVAFVGGLAAAGSMALVGCLALSVMASNDLALPVMLRGRAAQLPSMTNRLLVIRRFAIAVIMAGAFAVATLASEASLASVGFVAMTAVAQLGPALIGGVAWPRANARGAVAGVSIGLVVWFWTLVVPALAVKAPVLGPVVAEGPFGLAFLRPTALFGLAFDDKVAHAVFVSLALNTLALVLASMTRQSTGAERQQAALFCGTRTVAAPAPAPVVARSARSRATAGEVVRTVARYIGPERAEIAFRGYAIARGQRIEAKIEADLQTLRFAEHLLASAIGASSSRLVLSMLFSRRNVSPKDALKLLDDASAAMQINRDVLQNALDHARQGVTAIDREMKLVAWNRQFRELFDLPEEMIHFGVGLDDIFHFNAARGLYGPIDPEPFIADRIERFVVRLETLRTRLHPSGRVIEIRSARMPDGGVVTTYTDISDTVAAQEALERANETLERRVRERTRELTRLNQELARAKTEADEANISKTRFLAAASHDILQPLNAARLFATSLVERARTESEQGRLARNVESSLDAVEEILSTLLDISRLDTGVMKPELSNFRLDELTAQLAREFEPVAVEKGLRLVVMPTSLTVRSDRRLLRRVLQNLVSNAIKYTPGGRVLVGCRRQKGRVRIEVWDTGLGIAPQQQKVVFREFKRLEQGAKIAPGLGLGLSIVERIARVLDHPITLRSRPEKGSIFALEVPVGTAIPATRPASGLGAAANPALGGLVALVIDNEPAIIEGMKTLLGGWGCKVHAASSQKEAEQVVSREKATPDVMLVDYHLDNADGLEAIVSLRWKLGRPIPAVLITADRSAELHAEAAEKRVSILPKPIRPAALRALLSQLVSRRDAAE